MDSRKDNTLKLQDLPLEIHFNIARLAGAQGFLNLKNTCSLFRPLQYDGEGKTTQPYEKIITELRLLLGHAAIGEWESAKMIWLQNPSLLTCYGTIHHPNNIYPENQPAIQIPLSTNPGTPLFEKHTVWQIALMNEAYDEAAEMEVWMTKEEKQKQFLEIFPDGAMQKEGFDLKHAKILLQNAFDAIAQDKTIDKIDLTKMNDKTKLALDELHAYAKPSLAHHTGLVFDVNFYLEAVKLFDEKVYQQFKGNAAGCKFWNIRVEEWLAACLPTGYLRLHAQGLGNEPSLPNCVLADKSSYFAFRREPTSIPGLHFFVSFTGTPVDGKGVSIITVLANRGPKKRAPQLEKYMEQKHKQRQGYEAAFAPKCQVSKVR